MSYNSAAECFHTKKLYCSLLFHRSLHFSRKKANCAFLTHPLGDLGATYTVRLWLVGKPVVDFLLEIIELFCARCYGWGATSEYPLESQRFRRGGSISIENLGWSGRPPRIICAALDRAMKVGQSCNCYHPRPHLRIVGRPLELLEVSCEISRALPDE